MAKDKKISELPEITQAVLMGLNRSGIITVNDLVAAEFDKVAYVIEDYNEATRLVNEARRMVEHQQSKRSRHHGEPRPAPLPQQPVIPGPLAPQDAPATHNAPSVPAGSQPVSGRRPQLAPVVVPAPTDSPLQQAMSIATRGLFITSDQPGAASSRQVLAKRLSVAGLLLRYGASESDVVAAMILEPAESGAIVADEVAARFGNKVERTLEECAALRAVPMLPSGKLPRYYLDMAQATSVAARRVCAAFLPYITEGPHGVSGLTYARLLCEALEAGGPDELVAACKSMMSTGFRAAA